MFLTITKEQIIDGLQRAAHIIPNRSGAAYLRTLWIKAEDTSITIMTTDANIEFTGCYTSEIKEPGLVGVNGRNLVDLIRRLPNGNLSLELDKTTNMLIIKQGKRTYKMPTNDPVWFQPLATFPQEGSLIWSGIFFQELLDKISFCISDDESTDAISCLYMQSIDTDYIHICGLNGHQFAISKIMHKELASKLSQEGILLQKRYVSELRKWLNCEEIEINITEKKFFVRTLSGQETLSLPRAMYTYPDYNAFLTRLKGENMSSLIIQRKHCLEALDRISIFNTESDKCTYFEFNESEAILSTQGQDTGSANEFIEAQYKGSIEKIAFPTKNLMEILNHYQSEEVTFTLTGADGPCGINGSEDTDYTVLIMPMKTTEQNYYTEET